MEPWKKQEIAVEAAARPDEPPQEAADTAGPAETEESAAEVTAEASERPRRAHARKRDTKEDSEPSSPRYSSGGARRGQYRFAAWLGLVVILLALFGLLTLLSMGIRLIQRATDHSALQAELEELAAPLIEYPPKEFASIDEADPESLLIAAIYRLADQDRIYKLQNHTDTSRYVVDEYGRLVITVTEVNESFRTLFGSSVTPVHQTIGEHGGIAYTYEYDKANAWYHVPAIAASSLYTSVTEGITVSGKTATLRVGYALTSLLDYDSRGRQLPPTASQMSLYRYFTFTKTEDGWILSSLKQETVPTPSDTSGSGGESSTPRTAITATTTTTEATEPTTEPTTEDTAGDAESGEPSEDAA